MPTCSHGASTFPLVNGDISSSGGELRSSPRRSASLPPSAARPPDMTAAVQLGSLITGSLAIDGIAVPDPAHRPVTAGERYRLVRTAARRHRPGAVVPAGRGDWVFTAVQAVLTGGAGIDMAWPGRSSTGGRSADSFQLAGPDQPGQRAAQRGRRRPGRRPAARRSGQVPR